MRRAPKSGLCHWHCGRKTGNSSGICDPCWQEAEVMRCNTDAGYRAWLNHKRAKLAKTTSEARDAHLQKARASKRAKRLIELPATELSEG
jgi:hypothetical protein